MTAKQTPLFDLLRMHADDIHSAHGHNKSSTLLSKAADRIVALEAERDLLKQEVFAVREQHGNALIECDQLQSERDRLASSLTAIEDEKNSYLDYVGDALGQAADGESLWDAAQRVLSERDRLRAELAECRRDNERLSEIGLITADALRLIGEGKHVPFQWMQKKLAALAAGRENNDGNA